MCKKLLEIKDLLCQSIDNISFPLQTEFITEFKVIIEKNANPDNIYITNYNLHKLREKIITSTATEKLRKYNISMPQAILDTIYYINTNSINKTNYSFVKDGIVVLIKSHYKMYTSDIDYLIFKFNNSVKIYIDKCPDDKEYFGNYMDHFKIIIYNLSHFRNHIKQPNHAVKYNLDNLNRELTKLIYLSELDNKVNRTIEAKS